MLKLKILKWVLMVFTITGTFFACQSKDETETRNTELSTDSTSYKNNMMADTANAAARGSVSDGPGNGGGYSERKDSVGSGKNGGPGAGGGYLERKDSVGSGKGRGPGLGGGYSERKDSVGSGKSRGPGVGGGYLAGEKDKKNGGVKK